MIEWLHQIGFKHLILFINSCPVLCGALQDPKMCMTLCPTLKLIFFPSTDVSTISLVPNLHKL